MFGMWDKAKIMTALQQYYNYDVVPKTPQMGILSSMQKGKAFKGLPPEESATRFMTVMLNSLNGMESSYDTRQFRRDVFDSALRLHKMNLISEDTLNVLVSVTSALKNGEPSPNISWAYDPSRLD